jgi:hypothetical protein
VLTTTSDHNGSRISPTRADRGRGGRPSWATVPDISGAPYKQGGRHGNQSCNQDAVVRPRIPETQRDTFAAFPLVDVNAVLRARPRETRR